MRRLILALMLVCGPAGSVDTKAAPQTAPPTPLTDEEVVRLVASGLPEREIVARIAARPADFDLAPAMLDELRAAGVSEAILEAMRRRQAQMPPQEPAPTPAPTPGFSGTLEIDFAEDAGGGDPAEHTAIAARSLPPRVTRRAGMEVGEVTDLALAVLCLTGDHVPDHWDARTPLTDAPRHELLLFRPGSAEETLKKFRILTLKHDPSYRVDLPEGVHNIVIGAAGKSTGSGTWRLLASDGARVAIARGTVSRLTVRAHGALRGNGMIGYTVDNEWKVSRVGEPPPGEAAAEASPKPRPSPSVGSRP